MQELWKPIPYEPYGELYSISNKGRARVDKMSKYSRSKTKYLKPGIGARGYLCYTFYYNGQKKQCFAHRLVALAFIDNPPKGKPLVCHLDDNKLNNNVDNLMWGSPADNMRHMVEHGRSLYGTKNPISKLKPEEVQTIRRLYQEGSFSQTELGATFGVNQTTISRIVIGQTYRNML